jgi:parallel beta-helix repeat protein
MSAIRRLLSLLAVLAGLHALPAQAETFHTCGTFINALPTVIGTQGVYCLSHDLSTSISAGSAIDIQSNNVTIDCNGFKIGGLAAGTSSNATGINAGATRLNITIRNCGIRGFYNGIYLQGGAGHLVEDNRLDNNLEVGIYVLGDNNRVRRNAIYDTGGHPGGTASYGIRASADVIDNTVAGVFGADTITFPTGIVMSGAGTEARGNQVRGLAVAGGGTATGIAAKDFTPGLTFDGNRVSAAAVTAGFGIHGDGDADSFCAGNTVGKFATAIAACQDAGGNASN